MTQSVEGNPLNVPNYIVTVKAGEILKNSIRINEITPSDENARSSYVLIGAARDANGTYVVRFVVNHFDNSVSSMDVLYAVNAKKEPAALLPLFTGKPALGTGSRISISDLLDYVNKYFPDILPEEVLKHYGYDSRPDGVLGKDALYKLPVGEDTSQRALLANAFEELAKTDAEKESIRKYQERVAQFQELETKLKDLRAQIRELYTADGKLDTKKIRELQFEANATANRIETLDRMLLRTESTQQFQNVLKREQDQARAREIKKAKDAVIAFRHDASAEIRETMRDYEAARSAPVGRDSDMDIIEREFLRVVREYEKEKQSGEKTAESLRRSLEREAQKHKKDNNIWEREFNRLLKDYEKSEGRFERLEKRVEGRDKTVVRNKIKAIGAEFRNMLEKPGKAAGRHAPRSLVGAVAAACELLADSSQRTNIRICDELRLRQQNLNAKVEERGLTKTRQAEADIIARKNARIVEATKKVKALQDQYAKMAGDPDNGIFYDEHIDKLIDQLGKNLYGTDTINENRCHPERVQRAEGFWP